VPPLQNGDRLTRPEFERRFDATPGLKRAELIEGIVYMPPPISDEHSSIHSHVVTCLGVYSAATPGVASGLSGSLRLDLKNMPQPDAFLRIEETHGGQSKVGRDRYVEGAPELVAEVAVTTASYDLHAKLTAYRRNRVREYIVLRVFDQAVDYFALRGGRYVAIRPAGDEIFRSKVFPGLWLDAAALLGRNPRRVLDVLQDGLNSPEHRKFAAKLARAAGR
jgi:Uma2 family endonuclease